MIEWQAISTGKNIFYRAQVGKFQVDVHHHIRYHPDAWLCTVEGVFDSAELEATTADAAKIEAVEMLRGALREALVEAGALNPYINIGCESSAQRHINCEAEAVERLCRFWVKVEQ